MWAFSSAPPAAAYLPVAGMGMAYQSAFVPLLGGFLASRQGDDRRTPSFHDGLIISRYLDAALCSAREDLRRSRRGRSYPATRCCDSTKPSGHCATGSTPTDGLVVGVVLAARSMQRLVVGLGWQASRSWGVQVVGGPLVARAWTWVGRIRRRGGLPGRWLR